MSATDSEAPPLLVVISGPSGVGKDTVMRELLERDSGLRRALTMTTRAPRENHGALEESGVDYLFVSESRFGWHAAQERLLEHAGVHAKQYGSPRWRVRALVEAGYDVVLQVDVQGARTLRGVVPGALFVFIAPDPADPSQLDDQLAQRKTPPEVVAQRQRDRATELEAQREFEHVIVNRRGRLEETVAAAAALIERERGREGRARVEV
ncbi:MAG: guanylate kinase [Dehalococcoidia bacterium]|nr:guanylate kinase [Dehalococcoidia bacterium]